MKLTHLPPIAIVALLLASCTKDEGPLHLPPVPTNGGEPIDTVYFSGDVIPILQQHCWVCHPPNAGMDLGADMAYDNLVNVTTTGFAPMKRVVPGDLINSVLWHKVSYTGLYGLNMPPAGEPLTAEELQIIRDWIEQGAMDN